MWNSGLDAGQAEMKIAEETSITSYMKMIPATQEIPWYTRSHERGTPRIQPQPKKSPIFPSSSQNEGPFPCFIRKWIPAFLSHLKRRRSQMETREELQGSCHNSKRPWCPNSLQTTLIPLHWLDCDPEYWLKTWWPVWQPCGTSRESHRSLCQLDRKPDTTFTALEESGLPWLPRRLGLTPLLKLYRNPKIHVSTGEEPWGSGLNSRWRPTTLHWLEKIKTERG